ncbi:MULTISPECIES: TPM domain-containing protein [unclassified Microbacterium]|uniref:TPM domain-containing protein n=1 Tax=unclassified Microbacterium TaxID=2609290 RepID=UPI00214C6443|nr:MULTISPECIES: TPM domain-containing protein [unclassified Microbacterium]MCR2810162.1 TPM domain-containing protein [Microbacterium sp. zg.B185]WIM20004.1 TPM domain-containing protein [Microbacterium sp. zg-B185]
MRARWAVALTTALTLLFAGASGTASATDPVTLGAGYVLDDVGALSSAQANQAQTRLEQLKADTGVDLWVVFVDEFTDPTSSEDWANTTAEINGLGPTQYLLAVATETRQFYISGDSEGPVTFEQLGTIEQAVQPRLADEDWVGAVDTAAAGFSDAADGGSGSGAVGGGFPTGLIIFLVIAAIAVVAIVLVLRNRRRRGQVAGGAEPAIERIDVKELARRASSALVHTDDAVKTSEQELGFARAQFGDAATVEFQQALQKAHENLNTAFTLKQQLDDTTEDTDEQTRAWNTEIIRLCEEANAGLDDKAAAFDELRRLEQNAPEALARVKTQRDRAAASIEEAAAHLRTLSAAYAPEALATVADNAQQASQRIVFADEQLAAADAAIGAGRSGEAAVSIRAAEESVGQAVLLEEAIDKLGRDLAEGDRSAAELIIELEGDIATASALPDTDGRVAAAIAATRQQVDAAKANLASSARRPLQTLQSLEAANAQIDGVVAGVRDAAAKAQRARQMVGQQIMQAQAQVSAAEDYITARRGAIGAAARTRLAEAGAALAQAQQLQAADPEQALQYAQRANQLAGQAIQHAQTDVGAFQGGGMGGMLGGLGGGSRGGDSGGMLGAILGGIVINSMLGGGSGRGSSGGMGGMRGGGGRSRISPGSFGGGGTRGRRGGGRF